MPRKKPKPKMDILYRQNSRQLTNTTLEFGPVLLSQIIDVSTCGDIRIHLEIESMNPGASIICTYSMMNGAEYMGGSPLTYNLPGRYEMGFSRSDFDNTTSVEATVQFIGRSRINATIYNVKKGEFVPEDWW
jgi:hypothetical protein